MMRRGEGREGRVKMAERERSRKPSGISNGMLLYGRASYYIFGVLKL